MLALTIDEVENNRAPKHANIFLLHKIFYCAKVSNEQSAKVICRFDRLRAAHSN